MKFENIKNIDVNNLESWQNKMFITFDIDWCSDEVLSYTLDIIEKYSIKATFFVTHETKLLERMRNNPNIELGIHPNFNPLLIGDFRYGKNFEEVIEYYKKIVPESMSVRSHSMTQNSPILHSFEKFGLIYDCNTFIPYSSNIEVKPYNHWTDKLIKVPYFWEDDVHCIYGWKWDVKKFSNYNGIKVFDFHPIHIFLNSENMDRYENSREVHRDFEKLKEYVFDEYATRSFLFDLINLNIKEKMLNTQLDKNIAKLLEENQIRFFERVYSDGLEKYKHRLKQYGLEKKEKVLEAGCGFGQWSFSLAELNKEVVGIEFDKNRVLAVENLIKMNGIENFKVLQGSIESLPFEDNSFDAVFCYGVIFLTDWKKSLKELCRVLKPNGTLYVNANGKGWYHHLIITEHNKDSIYNPRQVGINAFINTDRYKNGFERLMGTDIIIDKDELVEELSKNCCEVVAFESEGKINANEQSISFYKEEYFGELGVYEVLANKTSSKE